MCGISGIYNPHSSPNHEDIMKMTNILSHRGPDAEGVFRDELVALGHRRLSILDLSENGNQPMYSQNQRYVMVYNGEVYNYEDIASELRSVNPNIQFNSSSDSEIILEAYSFFGVEAFKKYNGMFALAIYDKQTQELILVRDRVGIKPLYFYHKNGEVLFSSELKSIQKVRKSHLTLNKKAISLFLQFGFIPAPFTIYNEVYKVLPGEYIKIHKEQLQKNYFYSITEDIQPETTSSENNVLNELEQILYKSVTRQLKSDVPYGVFLSGGIDSSLLTALASKISTQKIETFSIGFKEQRFNEAHFAKRVSSHLNTQHHEFMVSYKDTLDLLQQYPNIYDEPYGDSSAFPTLLVSKLARQHVTVALSGEGGDELFLGYGSYVWANRLQNPLLKTHKKTVYNILSNIPSSRIKRAAHHFLWKDQESLPGHIYSQEQYYFSTDELTSLLSKHTSASLGENFLNLPRDLNPMEQQALFDIKNTLPGDLLTKVDRASMHFSLEARVPYLDNEVLAYALNISPYLKYKNSTHKYILKQVLYKHVPSDFFNRPKRGFAIPLVKWLKKEWYYLILTYLDKKLIEKYNIVNYSVVEEYMKRFMFGEDYLFGRIWLIIVLHQFLEEHVG